MNTLLGEFVNAVAAMRSLQRMYFKARTREALIQSIEAEREVDRLVVEIREQRDGVLAPGNHERE